MKKFIFLLAVVFTALQLSAADVSPKQAQAAAKAFITKEVRSGSLNASAVTNLKLVKAEASVAKPTAVDYYIFNTDHSYVVVAGDDQAPEILMYGVEGNIDLDNIPPGMQWLLNKYKYQIDGIKAGTLKPVKAPMLNVTAVPPLVTANWDQSAPYNNQCPTSGSRRAVTGCPATSLAMCFYKWKWPTTYPACAAINGSSSGGYSAAALPAREADWDNIIDEYTGPTNYTSTSAQKEAVAWLMRYVGQSIPDYMYGYDASGANDPEILEGCHNMGYTDARYLLLTELQSSGGWWGGYTNGPQQYTDAQWTQFMLDELYNGRPIEYLAYDCSSYQPAGHAFNVFGVNGSGQFYVNWGWSGDSNGYCTLHNFTTATGATGQSGSYVFNYGEAMIVGIEPPGGAANTPSLTVEPTSLSFTGCTTGQTYTKTFTVTGANLTGNVTLSSSNNKFTVSPSTLTAAQAQAGATVTVTFSPTSAGTVTGNITVASSGASSKTVTLTGTATAPTPKLTVNPTSLSFTGTVGQTYTQTFTVTGTDLTGNVNISSSISRFSVSPATLTAAQAMAGATVTVTYSPTTEGTQNGQISVSSSGATNKTVSVTGTATSIPTITVNPTSVNLTTVVGTPVTQRINVMCYNLTERVDIAVNGTGFTVDKNNITRSFAISGNAYVDVTYRPTTVGNHTGTVTLTSTGAETVTIPLNGTATEPVRTITATPNTLNFTALVGETITNTFTVTGENLTGDLSLAVDNDAYSIEPTTISVAEATAGKTVTVTYAPTTFGVTSANVTISGGGAPSATVALNGQADLVKYAPVMLPAEESGINLTKFRADWTDQTPDNNVTSYTLEVSAKSEPLPEPELIATLLGTDYQGSATGYYDITLSAPWAGTAVRGGLNSVIYFRNNYNNNGVYGNITYTIPAGYENAVFTMKITTGSSSDGVGNLTVATPQTSASTHSFTAGETFTWVVTASSGEKITITSPDAQFSPDIVTIEVWSGNASVAKLLANESGDATYRLITGITDKFYTIENLTPEGTFLYKVKALYADGTESDWSNIEEVTLFENNIVLLGDVNRDGVVTIKDVTDLIDYLLGNDIDIDMVNSDVNEDGVITIKDATDISDMLLGGGSQAALNMARFNSGK
jgi:hypothetical protein